MIIEDGLVEVGDKVIYETFLSSVYFIITRVTKTLAFSKKDSDDYEYTFKRKIGVNMAHPPRNYDTAIYTVERKQTKPSEL